MSYRTARTLPYRLPRAVFARTRTISVPPPTPQLSPTVIVKTPTRSQNEIKDKIVTTKKIKSGFIEEVLADIRESLRPLLNKPLVLLSILIIVCIVFSHDQFDQSVFGKWVFDNKAKNNFAKWIADNQEKFFGILCFIPVFLDLPEDKKWYVAGAAVMWVWMIRQHLFAEYAIQALALHTFFKVKKSNTRFFVLLAVFAAWYLGWVVVNVHPPKTMPSVTPIKNK